VLDVVFVVVVVRVSKTTRRKSHEAFFGRDLWLVDGWKQLAFGERQGNTVITGGKS